MSSLHQYPAISAHNEETEQDRISRLHEAFGVMCAIARMVWREETGYGSTEPGLTHTRWMVRSSLCETPVGNSR